MNNPIYETIANVLHENFGRGTLVNVPVLHSFVPFRCHLKTLQRYMREMQKLGIVRKNGYKNGYQLLHWPLPPPYTESSLA